MLGTVPVFVVHAIRVARVNCRTASTASCQTVLVAEADAAKEQHAVGDLLRDGEHFLNLRQLPRVKASERLCARQHVRTTHEVQQTRIINGGLTLPG